MESSPAQQCSSSNCDRTSCTNWGQRYASLSHDHHGQYCQTVNKAPCTLPTVRGQVPRGYHKNSKKGTFPTQRTKSAPQNGFVHGNLPQKMCAELKTTPKCLSEIGTNEMVHRNKYQGGMRNGGCTQSHIDLKQKPIAWEISSSLPAEKQQPGLMDGTTPWNPMFPGLPTSPVLRHFPVETTAPLASRTPHLPPLKMNRALSEVSSNPRAAKPSTQVCLEDRESHALWSASGSRHQSRNVALDWEAGSSTSIPTMPGQYIRHKPNSEYLKLGVPQRHHKSTPKYNSEGLHELKSTQETTQKGPHPPQDYRSPSRCLTSVSTNQSSGRSRRTSYAAKYAAKIGDQSISIPNTRSGSESTKDIEKVSKSKMDIQVSNLKEILCMSRIPDSTVGASGVAVTARGISRIPRPPLPGTKEHYQELSSETTPDCPDYNANTLQHSSGVYHTSKNQGTAFEATFCTQFWVTQEFIQQVYAC